MFTLRKRGCGWTVLLSMLIVGAGCSSGGPEIAYVSGRVTLDGKPLSDAAVVFIPDNGRPAGATTDADGNYVLNFAQGRQGAIPGTSTVRISTYRDADQDDNGQTVPGKPETIPPEYNTETTLTFEVEPNKDNVANFDLKSSQSIARR
jgi:hypothetical protein